MAREYETRQGFPREVVSMDAKIEYAKPQIVDYGTVEELTAGCHGSPKDFHGKNNALTDRNSRGMCFSTP